MLGGQRDERQAVGAGRWLARDARVGQARRDGRGHLQVPGHLGVIAGYLAGRDPGIGHLAVEQAPCLGARFPVGQPQPALSQVRDTGDATGHVGSQHQPFPPRTEPDHLTAAGQQLAGRADVVLSTCPRRCVPATCTSPSAASASASRLGHGHQVNPTGGSSSPSGASSSGSAGSQPAATKVGRGGWMGRTVLVCRPRSLPVSATSPPAGRNPARLTVSPRNGSATCPSPTRASVTLAPLPPSGATSLAATGTTESSVPNRSSTVRP